jgi:uncharacterized protein (TIGR03083 family)
MQSDLVNDDVQHLLPILRARAGEVVGAARTHVDRLNEPSALPGWTRLTIVTHLRYVNEAMHRMTVAALAGTPEAMYPGGRATTRPGTLVPRVGETTESLVDSLATTSESLDALWATLTAEQWQLRFADVEFGPVALSRYLALRLTEFEVHGTDLALPGTGDWHGSFVDAVLPLRVSWLALARRRPDADLAINGTWSIGCGNRRWRVNADGADVQVVDLDPADQPPGGCHMKGSSRTVLAYLLGRAPVTDLEIEGAEAPASAFKRAFPGP